MNGFLKSEANEPDETRIFVALHGDAAAIGFAEELRNDGGFTIEEAIGMAEVASGLETEVIGMQFIEGLVRRNRSSGG